LRAASIAAERLRQHERLGFLSLGRSARILEPQHVAAILGGFHVSTGCHPIEASSGVNCVLSIVAHFRLASQSYSSSGFGLSLENVTAQLLPRRPSRRM
jgi:hypothetical protein